MRKAIVLCITVMFLIPVVLVAQPEFATDKGSMMIGGSASFQSSGGDVRGDDRLSVITLDTKIMHFIAQNLGIGGSVQFINQSQGDESLTYIMIGPTVAYYFGAADKKILPFVRGTFLYGNLSDEYSETIIKFGAGFTYMISTAIGLTSEAYYQLENYSPDGGGDSVSGNTFGIELGISAFIY